MSYPFPILNLNFAKSKQLGHPAVSFSRASQGSYWQSKTNTGSDGKLAYAGNNVPRFDHDPLTGICKGLLVEPAVTFLDTYSEQFDNAAWTKTRASITANAAVAPDGAVTAYKLVEDTTTNYHSLTYAPSLSSSGSYTVSYFVKAGEITKFSLNLRSDGYTNGFTVIFDLSASSSSGAANGTGAYTSSSIVSFGNGWYRVIATGTVPSTTSVTSQLVMYKGAAVSYTGDGTSGLYIWGAKIYAGVGQTSYLPTVASGVTRAADLCTVDLTKLKDSAGNSLWTGQEGTIVVDFDISKATTGYPKIAQVYADNNNKVTVFANLSTGQLGIDSRVNGATPVWITDVGQLEFNTNYRIALAFSCDGLCVSCNGSACRKTVAAALPVNLNNLGLLNDYGTVVQHGGHIYSVRLYNKRIPDEYLKLLSAL